MSATVTQRRTVRVQTADANGKPICSRYPAYVGGATLPKAVESLARHERRIAQVAA